MNTFSFARRGALVLGMSLVTITAFAQAEGGSGAGGTMGSISVPAGHTQGDKGTDHMSGTDSTTTKSTPKQNHHCKMADGTIDTAKSHKDCTAAKGKWTKDAADSTAPANGTAAK